MQNLVLHDFWLRVKSGGNFASLRVKCVGQIVWIRLNGNNLKGFVVLHSVTEFSFTVFDENVL